jgi:hypothetical protein
LGDKTGNERPQLDADQGVFDLSDDVWSKIAVRRSQAESARRDRARIDSRRREGRSRPSPARRLHEHGVAPDLH